MAPVHATTGLRLQARTLFDGLVPAGTVVVEADPPMWESGLQGRELASVALSVEKRRREFTAGRNCARRALALLGRSPCEVGVGAHREPLWPPGVVGSITHTDSYCAAALREQAGGLSIGIDAEPQGALHPGVLGLVVRPGEAEQIAHLRRLHPEGSWERLVFCAKEAFHKALFRRWPSVLDFLDAELRLDPAGAFELRLLHPAHARGAGGTLHHGRFRFAGGLVLAAATVGLPEGPQASHSETTPAK